MPKKPDLIIVSNDTNSALSGALTAAKPHIPVTHMEAEARTYDRKMPEETNRRLKDHCSTRLFTPTENCTKPHKRRNKQKPNPPNRRHNVQRITNTTTKSRKNLLRKSLTFKAWNKIELMKLLGLIALYSFLTY